MFSCAIFRRASFLGALPHGGKARSDRVCSDRVGSDRVGSDKVFGDRARSGRFRGAVGRSAQPRLWVCLAAALLLLLAGCSRPAETYGVRAQQYGRLFEYFGADTGTVYGRILFPSEYLQRSALLVIDGNAFVSNLDGRFLIEDVPEGSHALSLHLKGFEPMQRRITVLPDRYNPAGELHLILARGLVIGRTVDEKGQSAVDIPVQLSPTNETVLTDKDGIFQFVGVNAGEHLLEIPDERYFMPLQRFDLERGEQRNLGIISVSRVSRPAGSATAETTPRRRR